MLERIEGSPHLICDFLDGPKIELRGNTGDTYCITVEEMLPEGPNRIHALHEFHEQTFCSLFRKWKTNWRIRLWGFDPQMGAVQIDECLYDDKEQNVQIDIDTDKFAEAFEWLLQASRYKKETGCNLFISSKFNDIFKTVSMGVDRYIPWGEAGEDLYARYSIGKYPIEENGSGIFGKWGGRENRVLEGMRIYDSFKNPNDWKDLPIQQVASDILGMKYERVDPFEYIDKNAPIEQEPLLDITCHFVWQPFVEIKGSGDMDFDIEFVDSTNQEKPVFALTMTPNHWAKASREWYTDWLINIKHKGRMIYQHVIDCTGKKVLVSLESKSLGDTLAWVPYIEEFRKKHNCAMYASTFWNNLFDKAYPEINWIPPGSGVNNLYAAYKIGCWDSELNKNKEDWRRCPLQKIPADILGIDFKEIKPKMAIPEGQREIEGKYVAISEHASARCKYWNYPGGWQQIVNYLRSQGYKVVVISKEDTTLEGVIKKIDQPINSTINTIRFADFFMGVSSGPAWVAWAVDTTAVVISGTTERFVEFKEGIVRIINEDVCHGCFDDVNYTFDRGDWNWCPTYKDFECTRSITPSMVIDSIQPLLHKK